MDVGLISDRGQGISIKEVSSLPTITTCIICYCGAIPNCNFLGDKDHAETMLSIMDGNTIGGLFLLKFHLFIRHAAYAFQSPPNAVDADMICRSPASYQVLEQAYDCR